MESVMSSNKGAFIANAASLEAKLWKRKMGLVPDTMVNGQKAKAVWETKFYDKNGMVKTRNKHTNPSEAPFAGISTKGIANNKKIWKEPKKVFQKLVKVKPATMAKGEPERYRKVVDNYHITNKDTL